MSSAIVDAKFVFGNGNEYLIKELCMLAIGKNRRTNRWLQQLYHRIPFEYGDVKYKEAERILNVLDFQTYYVKDLKKLRYLKEILQFASVIDLESFGFPSLIQLPDSKRRC